MKKGMKYIALLLCLVCVLTACGTTYQEATSDTSTASKDLGNGYFTIVTEWSDVGSTYYIVYANDTKVKYLISSSGYRFGITPLYNSDGSLQVYEEENEEDDEDKDKDDVEEEEWNEQENS